ncbi:hypothetical protein N8344_00785 [bacterium]|nr:hypothetical protein [bacterium]
MRRLQLYIGNERVDLFKDETVSLTQTIKNVKDLAKVFTEFTQTFSVPASRVNNKIFQHYYNFDIINGFDARKKADAKLELNDLPFKDGKIALQGVELKNNVAHTYKITFFGNTVNLKDILTDDQLSSLSFSDYYDRIYDFDTVTGVMQDGLTPFIVPLITHTNRLIYNSGSHVAFDPEATINNLYHQGSGNQSQNGVYWNEFKYAVRLQNIIEAIQTKYDITFSDDFFNDNTNEQFSTLYMWLHRKSGSVERPTQVDFVFTRLTDLVQTQSQGISSVNNGIITVNIPNNGLQPNFLRVNLAQASANPYSVQVLRNGGLVVGELNSVTGNQQLDITAANGFQNNSTYTIQIGGVVTFSSQDIIVTVVATATSGASAIDEYKNSLQFGTNQSKEFNIIEQIPKMKIIDFLSGLFNMFNLTAYVNDVGTIVVRTLDSYYADSTQVYNIDKYLDTTKSTSDVALPYNKINFSYKGLGTLLAKQFEQLTNSGWGSLSYTLDGDIFDAPSEPYKIELPFEHMQFERLYDAGQSPPTSTDVQWGYSVNENLQSYIGEPLIFYGIPITNGTNIRIRDTVLNNNVEDITDYVIPSNSQVLSPSTNKFNIHFQNELNEYLANEPTSLVAGNNPLGFTDTLFETEYKEYIQDVFNFRRRLLKVTAYLPMKVYYNLQLNDLIELGQDSYKINSMKTDLTTGKTEFELLNTIL